MRERAWEAGDKEMEKLKKLRKENRERAKHISERKNNLSSVSFTGSWGSISSRTPGAGKPVCHSCQTGNHYANGHTASTQNLRRFLNKKKKTKVYK